MTDVVEFPTHERMTVEQCLSRVARKHAEFSDVIVCGYDEGGEFFLFSSHMSHKDALWLAMELVEHVRRVG